MDTITSAVNECHSNSKNHGFYEDMESILDKMRISGFTVGEINFVRDAFISQKLMLIVSELGEALEANRKGKMESDIAGVDPNTHNFKQNFEEGVKDTFGDELADAQIRLLDLAGWLNIPFEGHVKLKHLYNTMRPYKHNKQY